MAIMLQDDNNRENNEIKRLLGGMPKIEAPENFEYNLMVKINNGSFDLKTEKPRFSFVYQRLVPASAAVFTIFVLFFIYGLDESSVDTMLVVDPAVEDDAVASMHDSVAFREVAATFGTKSEKNSNEVTPEKSSTFVSPDGRLEKSSSFAIDNSKSVDLDSYIRGDKRLGERRPNNLSVVSGGEAGRTNRFNGFLYRQNDKDLDTLKARIDSIKKNMTTEKTK